MNMLKPLQHPHKISAAKVDLDPMTNDFLLTSTENQDWYTPLTQQYTPCCCNKREYVTELGVYIAVPVICLLSIMYNYAVYGVCHPLMHTRVVVNGFWHGFFYYNYLSLYLSLNRQLIPITITKVAYE